VEKREIAVQSFTSCILRRRISLSLLTGSPLRVIEGRERISTVEIEPVLLDGGIRLDKSIRLRHVEESELTLAVDLQEG